MMRGVSDPKNIGLGMITALRIDHTEMMNMTEKKMISIELEEGT